MFIFAIYYFFQDYIFAGLVFIVSILLTMASFKKPAIKKYSLDSEKIVLDDGKKSIPFSEIESYKIDSENMKILINTTNKITPLIHIPFEASQNVKKIDKFLSGKIKKDESLEIPLMELLLNKYLGF